jgi:hypothetical protein
MGDAIHRGAVEMGAGLSPIDEQPQGHTLKRNSMAAGAADGVVRRRQGRARCPRGGENGDGGGGAGRA